MRRDVALDSLAKLETNCLEADMAIASWLARVGGIEEDFGGCAGEDVSVTKLDPQASDGQLFSGAGAASNDSRK